MYRNALFTLKYSWFTMLISAVQQNDSMIPVHSSEYFFHCGLSQDTEQSSLCYTMGFPGGSHGKESTCNVGDLGLIPGSGSSLEKRMATHSSILAWRIPWTKEPSEPQSMGSKRVRHDWATNTPSFPCHIDHWRQRERGSVWVWWGGSANLI